MRIISPEIEKCSKIQASMVCLLYSRDIKVTVCLEKDGFLYYAVIRQLLEVFS